MEIHEARLANGLQIVAEKSPAVHSVALGFFVRTGSRDETDEVAGVSHFLEHMAFKGTARHSADDVNRVFDEVGAKYNASTSEEVTLFYAAVLPEYLPSTCDLLADIIRPALRKEDFDMEKKVILEEIGMYDDQPTYTAYENLMQKHFSGHPLGRSVLGTNESISALECEKMRAYHQNRYAAGNIILAVAGKFDWPQMLDLAHKSCDHWPAGGGARPQVEAHPAGGLNLVSRASSMQQHVMQMSPAPPADSPMRYAADILTVIVGDDTGSRLFWEMVDPGYAETAAAWFITNSTGAAPTCRTSVVLPRSRARISNGCKRFSTTSIATESPPTNWRRPAAKWRRGSSCGASGRWVGCRRWDTIGCRGTNTGGSKTISKRSEICRSPIFANCSTPIR